MERFLKGKSDGLPLADDLQTCLNYVSTRLWVIHFEG